MDIKNYIASGILELYAMDHLSPAERAEVERYAAQYPEIRTELTAIEYSLEAFAQAQAVAPPADLLPGINDHLDQLYAATDSVPMTPSTNNNWWKITAAVLGFGLLTLAYLFYQGGKNQQLQIDDLQRQLVECQERTDNLNQLQQDIAFLSAPESKFIELAGQASHSDAQAAVVHNTVNGRTLFNTAGLPAIAADRQYQLWAIVGGTTISLGVFDAPAAGSSQFVDVPFTANVDAFAVTLEPRGGSVNPTLEQMYVLGEAS